MDTEKVVSELNKRFAQPLPPYYKRRVIFWLDEEREYADKLDDFELENAKLVQLTGSNLFTVKKLLGHDDPYGNYVVYCPVSYEKLEDNGTCFFTSKSSGERYATSLERCSCPAYCKGYACKHMLALALRLGYFSRSSITR